MNSNHFLFHNYLLPHTDYISQIIHWINEDYESKDQGVNYEKNKKLQVATLFVSAGLDNSTSQAIEQIVKEIPKEYFYKNSSYE